MKWAKAVIGAAFGDEGKGLMTDYFARMSGADILVVRYNGGAQAGHTVELPNGTRHVFHTYSSGTFAGAQTFLSRDFLVNPLAWADEYRDLKQLEEKLGTRFNLRLMIDREAPITTIYDMLINRAIEKARGAAAHGSCGLGIHETVHRQRQARTRLFAADLFDANRVCEIVDAIRAYAKARCAKLGLPAQDWIDNTGLRDQFIRDTLFMAVCIDLVDSREIAKWDAVIFEGAQGLLLDAEYMPFFPHVTCSRTGLKNVIRLCQEANITELSVNYVMRSYMTRHGNGPLPGHDPSMSFEDLTNAPNEWQGSLRFAPIDRALIENAITMDLSRNMTADVNLSPAIAMTHRDQFDYQPSDWVIPWKYQSFGATTRDVSIVR